MTDVPRAAVLISGRAVFGLNQPEGALQYSVLPAGYMANNVVKTIAMMGLWAPVLLVSGQDYDDELVATQCDEIELRYLKQRGITRCPIGRAAHSYMRLHNEIIKRGTYGVLLLENNLHLTFGGVAYQAVTGSSEEHFTKYAISCEAPLTSSPGTIARIIADMIIGNPDLSILHIWANPWGDPSCDAIPVESALALARTKGAQQVPTLRVWNVQQLLIGAASIDLEP